MQFKACISCRFLLEIILGGLSIIVFGRVFKLLGLSEFFGVIIGLLAYSVIWRKYLKQ